MDSIEILKQEHRVIEEVLHCLERLVDEALGRQRLDGEAAREALVFLSGFADRCHHGKEEEGLFPLLEDRKGFSPGCGPTAVLRAEHRHGRMLLRSLNDMLPSAAEGDPGAVARFVRNARDYLRLVRTHIRKEEHCLFPDAARALSADDHAGLLETFGRIEGVLGTRTHDGLVWSAHDLAGQLGVSRVVEASSDSCGCGRDEGCMAKIGAVR